MGIKWKKQSLQISYNLMRMLGNLMGVMGLAKKNHGDPLKHRGFKQQELEHHWNMNMYVYIYI